MKKILIIGPIGDYAGRAVETNIIATSLQNDFDVDILSTGFLTEKSAAFKNLKNQKFNTLDLILFKSFKFKLLATIYYFVKNKQKPKYFYVNNKFSKKIFDYKVKKQQVLAKELQKYDLVILPVQLMSEHVDFIIDFCFNNKISCVIRTTGEIKYIPEFIKQNSHKITHFIHHSIANSLNLESLKKHNFSIIDQTTLLEEKILRIEKNNFNGLKLRFGFIGRLSKEKQILDLVNYFVNTQESFIIAGDGALRNEMLEIIKSSDNCEYLGLIDSEQIQTFFEKIDVLIISSTEETGPLVGIEALAAGKIIISTEVGAMPERLENTLNQFWIPKNNFEKELNNIVIELKGMDFNELLRISELNRKKYLEKYSQKIIQNTYLKTITNILNEDRR